MSNPAIIVDGISKQYRIGVAAERYLTFREAIVGAVRAPIRRWRRLREHDNGEDTIWAVKDVSFEVQPGEVLGIIGRNGAGKTTLLKILSRITEPTEGIARLRGRVASLLEVGTGFHPELTGRENIYLNGAILGMKKAEIDRKFDEIVAFAETEKFLDTPVKRYSSGMSVRLAFAVAAHLEPQILIVDEVLAVGDAAFQKRCLGKMRDVATSEGRTVLFVSHNMLAVRNHCSRVIWLDGGKLKNSGMPGKIVAEYLAGVQSAVTEQVWADFELAPGNETVRIRRAAIEIADGSQDGEITTCTPIDVRFEFWNRKPHSRLNLTVHLHDRNGTVAFETGPVRDTVWRGRPFPEGLFRSSFRIPGDLLNDGSYSVMLLVVEGESRVIYRHEDILVFNVVDDASDRGAYHGEWRGVVRPILDWQTELLELGRADGNKPATVQPDADPAPNAGTVSAGYGHAAYARSLAEFGTPRPLPQCGGWILERRIPGTELCDAMGCYPLFSCSDWPRLPDDLAAIDSRLVSLTLVADPFGDHTPELLAECFPDVCKPFKEHCVVNLERRSEDFVCAHHRRNARKGRRSVKVEVCQRPREFLDDWTRLYDALIQRHGIRGLTAFSKQSFALQMETPGIVALRAAHNGNTVGLLLWFVQEEVAYYHLGAFDQDGYALRASFALFWEAIEHFRAKGLRWLNLGGAAGLRDGEGGLARFKRGWANGSRTAFLCGRILDRTAYAEILKSRAPANNSYFPAYRAFVSD